MAQQKIQSVQLSDTSAAGTYTSANITVDTAGRITAAANGAPGGVTSIDIAGTPGNISSAGGPITSSGTVTLNLIPTAVTAGSYTASNITVDAYGRITAAANGSSIPALPNTEVAYGDPFNLITSTSDFTYDDSTGTLAVGPAGFDALVKSNTGQGIKLHGDTGATIEAGTRTLKLDSTGALLVNTNAGLSGQVLTSAGPGLPITWAPGGGGGVSFPLARSAWQADAYTNTDIAWDNGTLNDDGSSRIRGVNDDSFFNKYIMVCEGYASGNWLPGWYMYPDVDACFNSFMAVQIPNLVTSNIIGLDLVNTATAANGLAINTDPYNYKSGNITVGLQYPKTQITSVVGPFSTTQTAAGGGWPVTPVTQNVYRITAYGVCTGVSGQQTTIYVRYGSTGTTSDTAILTGVCNNGSASNIPFKFEADITVYNFGSMRVTSSLMNNGTTGISNQAVTIFSPSSVTGLPGTGQIKLWAVSTSAGSTMSWYSYVIENVI